MIWKRAINTGEILPLCAWLGREGYEDDVVAVGGIGWTTGKGRKRQQTMRWWQPGTASGQWDVVVVVEVRIPVHAPLHD
ncbi:unnamed protein product [Linum trigynum]|uniref:Uncharacterized protein n=1 Tax=Linum trigynum TaxID=586398 RepID=A0AAV2CZG7_9ROSI